MCFDVYAGAGRTDCASTRASGSTAGFPSRRYSSAPAAIKMTTMRLSHGAFRIGVGCLDRKSTRLNSSHLGISYAVFCLKKKKLTQRGLRCHGREHVVSYHCLLRYAV